MTNNRLRSSDRDVSSSSSLVEAAFYEDDLAARLHEASADTLNRASFGIIRLDDRGIVQFYNQFEEHFSGRSASKTIGRSFFEEVAPCTRNRLFQNRFERGLENGDLDTIFSYTFTYRLRPTLVDVRMLLGRAGRPWILVRPKAGPAA